MTTATTLSLSVGIGTFAYIISKQLGLTSTSETTAPHDNGTSCLHPRVMYASDVSARLKRSVDVIVVGSGAAGLMAGISAKWANPKASVLILERVGSVGGTTSKSGGVFWIPNNVLMKDGIDEKKDVIQFLVRVNGMQGKNDDSEERVEAYVETGRVLTKQLRDSGVAPDLTLATTPDGDPLFDYSYSIASQPDNKNPHGGRHLAVGMPTWQRQVFARLIRFSSWAAPGIDALAKRFPVLKEIHVLNSMGIDLSLGLGAVLVSRLETAAKELGCIVETSSGVESILVDVHDGGVSGVGLEHDGGFIGARRGVIFAVGGFSHDKDMVQNHLSSLVVDQTGASSGNDGSFHKMCAKLGVDLVDMEKLWGAEAFFNDVEWETPTCVFQMRGDSFFTVNGDGVRVYDEKAEYDIRRRVHTLCPENHVLFAICDERNQRLFASDLAKSWPPNPNHPLYVQGKTIQELAKNIRKRYEGVNPVRSGGPRATFTSQFESNLVQTTARFNALAAAGKDPDFGRGEAPAGPQWTRSPLRDGGKNPAMKPLSPDGPYFAIALVASMIDTKGGPKVDRYQRVMLEEGPIPRLYAAGNTCSASLSGDAYVSGGHTLGCALVGGYLAGLHAAALNGSLASLTTTSSKL